MKENGGALSYKDIEDKILRLIFLAEVNLECCVIIHNFLKQDYLKYTNLDEGRYLTLSLYNHFCESVGIIYSLLHKPKKKQEELSFQLYIDKIILEKYSEEKKQIRDLEFHIETLWKKFEKGKFPKIRNKICAHKETKNIGDPETLVIIPINYELIEKLKEITEDLKEVVFKIFENKVSNNYLIDIKFGLKSLINKIMKE